MVDDMQEALQRAIEAAERARCEATLNDNWAALQKILADRLTFIHSTGVLHDKPAYLEFLASKIKTQRIWRPEPPSYRLANGAVLAVGPVEQELQRRTDAGTVSVSGWTSQLWVPIGEVWTLIHQHSTKRTE